MKAFGRVRLGLVIAAALLAGTAAMAQGPGGGMGENRPPMEKAFGAQGGHGRWWNNPRVVERLKLTDEQRKAFDGILLEHREKLIDLRANVEKAELEMETLMGADQPNEARILAQIDKVAQARAELEKANARFLLAIRNKLTPEVQAFRAKHGEERGWEHHGQGQRGPGPGGQHHHQAPAPQPPPQGGEPPAPATPQP
jgi:Spy/CpxP family protein refolding chaperone